MVCRPGAEQTGLYLDVTWIEGRCYGHFMLVTPCGLEEWDICTKMAEPIVISRREVPPGGEGIDMAGGEISLLLTIVMPCIA